MLHNWPCFGFELAIQSVKKCVCERDWTNPPPLPPSAVQLSSPHMSTGGVLWALPVSSPPAPPPLSHSQTPFQRTCAVCVCNSNSKCHYQMGHLCVSEWKFCFILVGHTVTHIHTNTHKHAHIYVCTHTYIAMSMRQEVWLLWTGGLKSRWLLAIDPGIQHPLFTMWYFFFHFRNCGKKWINLQTISRRTTHSLIPRLEWS